jgi:hypothetical protein
MPELPRQVGLARGGTELPPMPPAPARARPARPSRQAHEHVIDCGVPVGKSAVYRAAVGVATLRSTAGAASRSRKIRQNHPHPDSIPVMTGNHLEPHDQRVDHDPALRCLSDAQRNALGKPGLRPDSQALGSRKI